MPEPPTKTELGAALRELRQAAGYSIPRAAPLLRTATSGLSRYETGDILAPERFIDDACDLYGADDDTRTRLLSGSREANARTRPRRVQLGRPGDAADRQQAIGERERASTSITSLGMTVVPGLLQVEPYMRAIVTGGGQLTGEKIEMWIANRRARAAILEQAGRDIVQIVSGPALLWAAGSAKVMREQVDHLIEVSRLPTVRVGIVPPGRPVDVFPLHNIDLYVDEHGKRTVVVGTLAGTYTLDNPFDVDRHARLLDRLAELAVWGDQARAELERVREMYAG